MSTSNRIPSLDGLRAVSILLVIAGHTMQQRGGNLAANSYLLSKLGVHTFFLISGFLITTLLQAEHERRGSIDLVAFYRRRCFRIFPACFAYILIIAALFPGVRSSLIYALTYSVSYFTANTHWVYEHLWSLSVEEQFYLLWPVALVIGFRHRTRIAWAAMIFAALFRLTLALHPSTLGAAYLHSSFPATMDSIAAGCLAAIYAPILRERFSWMADSPVIAVSLALTCWVLAQVLWGGVLTVVWGAVPLLMAVGLLILVERRDWILNNRVAGVIGVMRYSLYLWQEPFSFQPGRPVLLSLLLLLCCAIASYLLVVRPMIRFGARWQPQSVKGHEPPPEDAAAATLSIKALSTLP